MSNQEFIDGYLDGRNPDVPEPGLNRSACYRHSFAVGRAEIANTPILASVSRALAEQAIKQDRGEHLEMRDGR